MTAFDPYYHWLGIRDAERPPNHYRLLGLDPLEDDPQVISVAADRQMAHLRTFQNGPHAVESQRLLNEVALARVCLLDVERKRVYDQQLLVKRTTDRLAEAQAAVEQDAAELRPRIQVASPRGSARPPQGMDPASVKLGRPGRGNRDQLPRQLVVPAVVAAILFCVLGWWYRYRVDRPASAPLQARRTNASAPESSPAGELDSRLEKPASPANAGESSQPDSSGISAGGDSDGKGRSPDADTGAEEPDTEEPGDVGSGNAGSGDVTTAHVDPATNATEAAVADAPAKDAAGGEASSPVVTQDAASGGSLEPRGAPDWTPADLEVAVRPLAIRATDEASTLTGRLARRELDAVRATLNSWLKPGAVPPPATRRDDLHLVFDLLDEFWAGVDAGLQAVQPGASLTFGSWEVTVQGKTSAGLVLEMKTGKRHTFDVRRAAIHRDLAIALVEYHYRDSRPTAWRLAGLFLMLDNQGNVERAKDYLGRAEAEGFSTGFILDAVRRLGGTPVGAASTRGDRPGFARNGPRSVFRALD